MQNPLDKEQTIAVGELDAAAHLACSTISCCRIISPELSACFNHALGHQDRVDGERRRTGVVLAQLGGPCVTVRDVLTGEMLVIIGDRDRKWYSMTSNTGARFQIAIDGTPRTYRDRKDMAIEAATRLKTKNVHTEVTVRDFET